MMFARQEQSADASQFSFSIKMIVIRTQPVLKTSKKKSRA
jgi:hypothetical protein